MTTAAATAPSVVSYADWHDARDRTGPVVESFATRDAPIDDEPKPERGVDASTREGAFDVRAAVAFANERTVDRLQRRMEIEAEKEDARPSGSIASRRRGAACDARETISFVSIERGSQVLYHLERAAVTIQGRRAVANAAKTTGVDPEEVAATEAAACLAGHLPEEAYDRDEVVDAATLGDPGVDVLAATSRRGTSRDSSSARFETREDDARSSKASREETPPRLSSTPRGTMERDATTPPARSPRRRFAFRDMMTSCPRPPPRWFSSSNPSRSSNPAAERLREGMLLATPLVSAVRVARATTEAARVIRWARRNGSDVARAATHAREIFGALETGMLAPRFAAEVGNTIVVERVGVFDDEDVCAAAAMAHHAKHSPAIRALALGSPALFDATVRRASRAAFEATYPHPSLRRRRRFPDDAYGPVANWARLINALRQGAAAHRAAQLFSWCRRVLAESEGAARERFDLARRERPLELLVNAAFIFNPQQHAALAVEHEDASEDEYVDEKVDFTRLRKPVGAPADGVLDLVVDVLHEAILLAQHAHLLGGGDGWNPKHLVAHIVSKMVPPRDVRPKTSAMFARMMNIVLTAPGGRVAGAAPRFARIGAPRCCGI